MLGTTLPAKFYRTVFEQMSGCRVEATTLTEGSFMAQDPKPKRGMPRSLIYALIPGGFVLLVLILMLSGWWTSETDDTVETDTGVPESVEEDSGEAAQP